MAIMGADGEVIAQTHDALRAGLYERLLAHRADASSEALVGRPIEVHAGGEWIIPVSKRIDHADDSFGGIVFAGLNASHFTDFYAQVLIGGAGAMMLASEDGIVLARYTPTEGASFGDDMRGGTLVRRLQQRSIGSFLSTSTDVIETTPRYFSFRALPKYGLVVLVGSARSDVLRDLTQRKGTNYLVASLATLCTMAAAAALMALLNRQRRIIEALGDSEARLRATFDQAAVGICEVSLNRRLLRANRRFAQMLGYTERELQGLDMARIVHAQQDGAHAGFFDNGHDDRRTTFSPVFENRCVRKDGQLVWVLMTVARVNRHVAGSDYFIAVIQDITQQKAAQHELMFKNTVSRPSRTLHPMRSCSWTRKAEARARNR
jgi:PAS domain S-box-containing protein